MHFKQGLYIVSTPIGNISDITLRAIETLKNSQYIICEDTRKIQKLLDHYSIKAKLVVYNDHSTQYDREKIFNLIQQGFVLSLTSDAGTPLISDPGYKLVQYLKANDVHIDAIPGACSAIAALTLSYLQTDEFMFLGFVPKKNKEDKFLEVVNISATLIFFETSDRVLDTLKAMVKVFGSRSASIVREITKLYQETITGSIEELIIKLESLSIKGEIVLVIQGNKTKKQPAQLEIEDKIRILRRKGYSNKDLSRIISDLYEIKKSFVYDVAINIYEEYS